MIECLMILSKTGIIRFLKIYSENESIIDKKDLTERVFNSIKNSNDTQIIYDFKYYDNEIRRIAFRPFGSIFIITICDELENELAILDFINVIMKVFDEVFKNVCELHLIMNPDKLYLIIDEMISGGIVIETNKDEIISNYLSKC